MVKARERDAQLIADKKWIHLAAIKPETTVVRNVNLTVPDQYNYNIEVPVWSSDTIVKRGEGVVSLKPVIKLAEVWVLLLVQNRYHQKTGIRIS